jgi:hypothetical protein
MNEYLNRNFFKILVNLKADKSCSVTEFLEGYVIQQVDQVAAGPLGDLPDGLEQRGRLEASSFNSEKINSTTDQILDVGQNKTNSQGRHEQPDEAIIDNKINDRINLNDPEVPAQDKVAEQYVDDVLDTL